MNNVDKKLNTRKTNYITLGTLFASINRCNQFEFQIIPRLIQTKLTKNIKQELNIA